MKRLGWKCAVLLCWVVAQGHAQTYGPFAISGTVADSATGAPLAAATVQVLGRDLGTLTDSLGRFTLRLKTGTYVLRASYEGYRLRDMKLEVRTRAIENLRLPLTETNTNLEEIVVRPKDNPAHAIIRAVIKNKKYNRTDRAEAYEYEAYSRLALALDNVAEETLESPTWRGARGAILRTGADSTAEAPDSLGPRYRIPLYLQESITQTYYKRPGKRREIVMANRTAGVRDVDASILTSFYTLINPYENFIAILGKEFVSPIADGAFQNYDYFIARTERTPTDTTYYIDLFPRRDYDRVFKGQIVVQSGTWALKGVDLTMNERPNINFVEGVGIKMQFSRIDSLWVPVVNDVIIDFENRDDRTGLQGRALLHLSNYRLNQPREDKFFDAAAIEVRYDAAAKDSSYWRENSPLPLSASEALTYNLMDSLRQTPRWKLLNTAIDILFDGYRRVGKFILGPYSKAFSFNAVEGIRLRAGFYTADDFSERLNFGGHVAYGLEDQRWKYQADANYALSLKPRVEVGALVAHDIEQAGFRNFGSEGASLLASTLTRVPLSQLNYYDRYQLRLFYEPFNGLALQAQATHFFFEPGFEFFYQPEGPVPPQRTYRTTELGLQARIGIRQPYIVRAGRKVYLSTPWPQIYLEGGVGRQGLLDGDFDFTRTQLTLTNRYFLGRFGRMKFIFTAGKIWGTLPYPSLYVFRGSQTYATDFLNTGSVFSATLAGRSNRTADYDQIGYNLMYFYEFVADEYASLALEQFLDGWLFKKLPLLRRTKVKEVLTLRAAWGRLTEANRTLNSVEGFIPQAPDRAPYMEFGAGVENIFRFLRVDAIWRLNYRDPDAPDDLDQYNYNFGLRFDLNLQL